VLGLPVPTGHQSSSAGTRFVIEFDTSPPTPTQTPDADVNDDGIVDSVDLMVLMEQWHVGERITPTVTDSPEPTDTVTPTLTPTDSPQPTDTPTPTPTGTWVLTSIEMLSVAAGTFTMGRTDAGDDRNGFSNELPLHDVTLSAYQIGKYEVTNGQYCDVLNWALPRGYLENDSGGAYTGGFVHASGQILLKVSSTYCQISYTDGTFVSESGQGSSMENHPVVEVTWFGCVAFCNWLSEKEGLTPCYDLSTWELTVPFPNGYRLPTEAEWERAAAWGDKHWIYGFMSDTLNGKARCNYFDDDPDWVNPLALPAYPYTSLVSWFDGANVSPNAGVQTQDSPSPVGCYDMSGNVWEWCQDWYSSTYYSGGDMVNPTGPESASYKMVRGGGWNNRFQYCRSAFRSYYYSRDYTQYDRGFRVSRTP